MNEMHTPMIHGGLKQAMEAVISLAEIGALTPALALGDAELEFQVLRQGEAIQIGTWLAEEHEALEGVLAAMDRSALLDADTAPEIDLGMFEDLPGGRRAGAMAIVLELACQALSMGRRIPEPDYLSASRKIDMVAAVFLAAHEEIGSTIACLSVPGRFVIADSDLVSGGGWSHIFSEAGEDADREVEREVRFVLDRLDRTMIAVEVKRDHSWCAADENEVGDLLESIVDANGWAIDPYHEDALHMQDELPDWARKALEDPSPAP